MLRRPLIALTAGALVAGSCVVASSPVLAAGTLTVEPEHSLTVKPEQSLTVKPEHVQPGPPITGTSHRSSLMAEPPPTAPPSSRTGAAALNVTSTASSSNAFLTRPYLTWHVITSIFDHCNPDYTLDGRVCRFDGTVGLRSNGVDPSFSRGYAVSPGGSDYLYYDGHNGWDYALSYENVYAAAPGTVQLAGSDPFNPCFGQTITVDHLNGFTTRYAHLSAIYVSPGQKVDRGQVIAQSGNTGCSSGPHLHFGVYITSSWTAIDPWGWSGGGADPWSSDQGNVWLTGYGEYPLPFAPSGVTALPGNRSAIVRWVAPSFDGGTAISSYTVTSSPGGLSATVAGGTTTASVSGLTNGTSYTFTVAAVNSVGSGPSSSASNAVVLSAVPNPPTQVAAVPGNGSATVTWTPPTYSGGAAITDYVVTSAPGALTVHTATSTSTTVLGLTNGTTYSFTVAATNPAGTGLSSSPSNNVTPLSAGSWQPVGGVLTSGPDATSWGPGRLDLFVRGRDNALYHKWFDAGAWSGWESLGGILSADPAAVSWGRGHLDVLVRGQDNALYHKAFDTNGWSDWERLGGTLTSGPAVASWGANRLDVFARGSDNAVYHKSFDGTGWSDWESLGGTGDSDPSAVSWGAGRLDVFVRSPNGALYHKTLNAGSWTSWERLGGLLTSGPAAASWGIGRLDVFARGWDGRLYHKWFDGTGWSQWDAAGGPLASRPQAADPSAVSWGPGRIDVFAQGTDQGLYQQTYD